MTKARTLSYGLLAQFLPGASYAGEGVTALDLTAHPAGYTCLAIFAGAYLLVMAEEFLHLRKSKPVILAAGAIWCVIAAAAAIQGKPQFAAEGARHSLLEYAELMLFLLVAMTYINAIEERGTFDALRAWLVRRGFGFRALFWMTGCLSFIISPIADNLTTALIMCAVVMAVAGRQTKFVALASINIAIAANAGGAFSPFGDITTLMVWQKGVLAFGTFFKLLIPSLVNFLVPAVLMSFVVPSGKPPGVTADADMKRGARRIVLLFLATIVTAVLFHTLLHLPPVLGMLTGLGYLQLFGFYLRRTHDRWWSRNGEHVNEARETTPFDVFNKMARAEWDTLLFFYGVMMCVGGLGHIGYLALASDVIYNDWGATTANVAVGFLSAIVDNIPVMFAVLTMNPHMDETQWLLVTLTAGVGGSLLSIGSAAGVALMGQARGIYTFLAHLKWTPAILAGYVASIGVHLWLNG